MKLDQLVLNATLKSYFQNEWEMDKCRCSIEYANNFLTVKYIDKPYDKEIIVTYEGREVEKGHFRLSSKDVNGEATLHTIDCIIFEGWYKEMYSDGSSIEGMWQVVADNKLI